MSFVTGLPAVAKGAILMVAVDVLEPFTIDRRSILVSTLGFALLSPPPDARPQPRPSHVTHSD
jgi:hypothetical protein